MRLVLAATWTSGLPGTLTGRRLPDRLADRAGAAQLGVRGLDVEGLDVVGHQLDPVDVRPVAEVGQVRRRAGVWRRWRRGRRPGCRPARWQRRGRGRGSGSTCVARRAPGSRDGDCSTPDGRRSHAEVRTAMFIGTPRRRLPSPGIGGRLRPSGPGGAAHGKRKWHLRQCAGSGHRRQMSQDIGDTRVSRHRRHSGPRCSAMSKARLVITALFVENQTPSEVAARYGVHRSWVYRLKARYEAEGEAAFEPRSRRPKTSPNATAAQTVELVAGAAQAPARGGHDAGAETICWHLAQHHHGVPVTVHGAPDPGPARRGHARARRRGRSRPTSASRPSSPTRPGSPTSPTTAWPTGARRRGHHLARRPLPLRPAHLGPPPDHRADRARHVHRNRRPARLSRLHADRQRDGLHRPVRRREGRTIEARARTAPAEHRPEEQPARTTPPPAARSSASSRP